MIKLLLAVNVIIIFIFVLTFSLLPPEIPLFYSYAYAEEQLVPLIFLFFPLLLADFFIFFNKFLVFKFFKDEAEKFSKLLDYSAYFFLFSAFYMIVKTIILII